MSDEADCKAGDEVIAVTGAKRTDVGVKQLSNEEDVYGVLDPNGAVRYFTKMGPSSLL